LGRKYIPYRARELAWAFAAPRIPTVMESQHRYAALDRSPDGPDRELNPKAGIEIMEVRETPDRIIPRYREGPLRQLSRLAEANTHAQ